MTMSQLITGKSAVLAGATALSAYLLVKGIRYIFRNDSSPRILKLIIYPIKSLAGIEVDRFQVTGTGVQFGQFHDRSYVLLNESGNMITQRTKPKLSLITTSFHGDQLWLDAPGMETLKIDPQVDAASAGEVVEFQVWSQDTTGIDCGEKANQWFSRYLGAPTKLIKFVSGNQLRQTKIRQGDDQVLEPNFPIKYQDQSPLMLINQPSIDDLNRRLDRSSQVTYRNFRPNLLVRTGGAFYEDAWKDVAIGAIRFFITKPCTRCTFTTVIPEKGVKHPEGEPLRTLRQFRINKATEHIFKDSPLFGIQLAAHNQGEISLRDEIVVA